MTTVTAMAESRVTARTACSLSPTTLILRNRVKTQVTSGAEGRMFLLNTRSNFVLFAFTLDVLLLPLERRTVPGVHTLKQNESGVPFGDATNFNAGRTGTQAQYEIDYFFRTPKKIADLTRVFWQENGVQSDTTGG
jgi:hypothetical protein